MKARGGILNAANVTLVDCAVLNNYVVRAFLTKASSTTIAFEEGFAS